MGLREQSKDARDAARTIAGVTESMRPSPTVVVRALVALGLSVALWLYLKSGG